MSRFKDPDKVVNVSVEGYDAFEVEGLKSEHISIISERDDHLIVRVDGSNIDIKILRSDFQEGNYILRLNGKNFDCKVQTNLDLLIRELGFNQVKKSQEKEIYAPMPGMVLDTQVESGSKVKEDQVVLTLEAMKMENIIKSPQNGTIDRLHVKKGDKVEKNQLLVTFL